MGKVKLIRNIKALYGIDESGKLLKRGNEMSEFACIENAWLLIDDGKIADYGKEPFLLNDIRIDEMIDASGRMLFPAFIDSHTHIVFAASREEEFQMRIRGKSYEEIAAAGGGILNSAKRLHAMSEDALYAQAWNRLQEVMAFGTGAIEIKSGYGLTVEDELKMLRVIRRLKEKAPIPVKRTFLGAHAFPMEYKNNHEGYLRLIEEEMLPRIADESLADYCDVFCDQGFFSVEETDRILTAAAKYGLKPKIHGNELGYTGGVQVAVKNAALSVDHLEYTASEEIEVLLNSQTMPVALPNCSFFLGIPYAPGRKMIDAGLPFCLASDYNPGSSPNGRMSFVVALACIKMKLTPEEAMNAVTINGAYAIELSDVLGSITKGKQANFFISKAIPSLAYIPYAFGVDPIESVFINGKKI